jgi:uncharacterized protein
MLLPQLDSLDGIEAQVAIIQMTAGDWRPVVADGPGSMLCSVMRVAILDLRRGLETFSAEAEPAELGLPGDWFPHRVALAATAAAVPGGWCLDLEIRTVARRACDRCLAELEPAVLERERCWILEQGQAAGQREEDRLLEVAPDQEWAELDQIVRDALCLAQPEYFLCAPDCRGLCPGCGQNLNERDCGCRPPAPASPLQALAGLRRPD